MVLEHFSHSDLWCWRFFRIETYGVGGSTLANHRPHRFDVTSNKPVAIAVNALS